MGLSELNGWRDKFGNTYAYFSVKEISRILRCGHDKATKSLRELESAGLIRREKQGLGRPDRVYVPPLPLGSESAAFMYSDIPNPGVPETRIQDFDISAPNKTEIINTEFTENYPSICGYDPDEMEEQIKENIDYEILTEKEDRSRLDSLVMLMVDVICGTGRTVRIGGSIYPREAVRSRFLALGPEHIEYVIDRMKTTTADIRNIRAYMLTTLFNAPATIDSFYQAKVQHDMPELVN